MMPLVICTDVIVFLVRCPEGIRTECNIRLRDSQTQPAVRPLDLGRTCQMFFYPVISPIPLLSAAPKGIGLKSNIRLSRVLIIRF